MMAKTPSKASENVDCRTPVPACRALTKAVVIVSSAVAFIGLSFGEGLWSLVCGVQPGTRNQGPLSALLWPVEHQLLVHPVDTFDGQRFGEPLHRLRSLIGCALHLEPRQRFTDGALDLGQTLISLHI